jgi:SulP family sulfate permease
VLISGIAAGHDDVLSSLGLAASLRRQGRVFLDTPSAIDHARTLLGAPSTASTGAAVSSAAPEGS